MLFLAEAFTKPAMMHALGKAGFHQGYTYFTWRNEKWELEEYLTELTTETDSFFRPNFFVNTPDILPTFLQTGRQDRLHHPRRAGRHAGAAPGASTPASSCSRTRRSGPGREEYLDSEKFQYRPRDWEAAEASGENLNLLLGRLNQIRREHPALQQLRNLHFHHAPHDSVIVYSKRRRRRRRRASSWSAASTRTTSSRPRSTSTWRRSGWPAGDVFLVHDELTGQTWRWGQRAFVRLTHDDPATSSRVVRYGGAAAGPPP